MSGDEFEPNLLPAGHHPGFAKLKSRLGVYRCKLRPVQVKRDPNHADYSGVLELTNSKAFLYLWVHADGSLGLCLEKMTE